MTRFGSLLLSSLILSGCTGFSPNRSPDSANQSAFTTAALGGELASIQNNVFGTPLTISVSARTAGAIDSLTWNGMEFIDAKDHGRELQTAFSFDNAGECLNPTEAGSSNDSWRATSTSRLLGLRAAGNVLATTIQPAYWLAAGSAYSAATQCGGRADLHQALNTTNVANDLIAKNVTIGIPGFENAIEYLTSVQVADNHSSMGIEAVTGYMPANFSSFYMLDMTNYAMTPLSHDPEWTRSPVIMATPDGSHAMGAYMPDSNGVGDVNYARYYFPDTAKWSVVVNRNATPAGTYNMRTLIAVGNLTQVRATLMRLDVQAHPGKIAPPAVERAGFFTVDGRGIYYSNGQDAVCPIPSPTVFAAMGGDPNLNNVDVIPGVPTAQRIDGPCGQAAPAQAAPAQASPVVPPGPSATTSILVNQPAVPTLVAMQRFFNPASGEHFLTAIQAEGTNAGFSYEGVAFKFLLNQDAGSHPIYRCYTGGMHFISLAADCEGLTVEGVYGWVYDQPANGRMALYRLYNAGSGDHLSTVNPNEGADVGYVVEGVQGYVY